MILSHPTGPFTILEPQDLEIGDFYAVQKRHPSGTDAPKVWKGRSGSLVQLRRSNRLNDDHFLSGFFSLLTF